jgi:hypothetical protein
MKLLLRRRIPTKSVGGMPTIISKDEALERGLARYFTGKPCRRGHTSERYVNGNCVACTRVNTAKNLKPKTPLQCIRCDGVFTPRSSNNRLFCSTECRRRRRLEATDERWAAVKKAREVRRAPRPPLQCAECQSEFDSRSRGNSRFCSDECRLKHSWRGMAARGKSKTETEFIGLLPSHRGAHSQLVASAWLMSLGYWVFWNVCPTGPIDVVCDRDEGRGGRAVRCEDFQRSCETKGIDGGAVQSRRQVAFRRARREMRHRSQSASEQTSPSRSTAA